MPLKVLVSRCLVVGSIVVLLLARPQTVHLSSSGAPTPETATSDTQMSEAAARALEAKIQVLSDLNPVPRTHLKPVVITQPEANSYLKYRGQEFLPQGVTHPEVQIHSDHLSAAADVDLARLNQSSGKSEDWQTKSLAWLFREKQRVSARGKLESGNGQGKLTITSITVGQVELPQWLVDWMIDNYVQPRSHVDLRKPFALPDHVTRVELGPGRATFYRSSDEKTR